jgi:hypothetical protein
VPPPVAKPLTDYTLARFEAMALKLSAALLAPIGHSSSSRDVTADLAKRPRPFSRPETTGHLHFDLHWRQVKYLALLRPTDRHSVQQSPAMRTPAELVHPHVMGLIHGLQRISGVPRLPTTPLAAGLAQTPGARLLQARVPGLYQLRIRSVSEFRYT